MIPTADEIRKLWDAYDFPDIKRTHVRAVAAVANILADAVTAHGTPVNLPLLMAGAYLHDIDKHAPKLPGDRHPDAGVRILREAGYDDLAALVRTHPVHSILDPEISPKSMEEKILFLSDKMAKYEVISVDGRFALWNAEHLPEAEQSVLDRTYPLVKALEAEILGMAGLSPEEVAKQADHSILVGGNGENP